MNDKTHYRKAFNSPYLSSADIVEPTVLTITNVRLEPDKTKKTKDHFNTAYFAQKDLRPGEPLKPMILNAHNSKVMAQRTKSKFLEDWVNIEVIVYVDSNVRFGRDTVEGLRISPEAPKQKPTITKQDTKRWDSAKAAYIRDGNFHAVTERANISIDDIALIVAEVKAESEATNGVS